MKLIIALLALSTAAKATTLNSNEITADVNANQLVVQVEGKAAQTLFFSMDVVSEHSFGIVQIETKTANNAVCTSSILGDIPGQMTRPVYNCTFAVNLK